MLVSSLVAMKLVVRWLAVRQARVRISARHPREVLPTQPAAMKIWRRASANVMSELLYECMYCNRKIKIYKKSDIRPPNLKKIILFIFLVVGPVLASRGGLGALQPIHDLHHGSLHHEAQGWVQVQDGVRRCKVGAKLHKVVSATAPPQDFALTIPRGLALRDVSDERKRRGC